MSVKGKLVIAVFIAVLLSTAFGLYRLFALRFEKGDIFPAYSSLRSDPQGCKALYEVLASTGLDAGRNFRPPQKLKGTPGRTIYWLATDQGLLDASSRTLRQDLEALAGAGNRLVIAFAKAKTAATGKEQRETGEAGSKGEEKGATGTGGTDVPAKPDSSTNTWGVHIGSFPPSSQKALPRPGGTLAFAAAELPATMALRSSQCLALNGGETPWRTVYRYREAPLILERSVGKGSIVLLADGYLLSNEALRNDPSAGLLSWLQGTNRQAVFEEAHLGVYEEAGVMGLVRKHRLIPLLWALIALAGLYVWKNGVAFAGFAPSVEPPQKGERRDHFSGLVNLLKRNLNPRELPGTCLEEWLKSFSREMKVSPDLPGKLRALVAQETARPAGRRDPVAVYGKMAVLLTNFRRRHNR